MADGGEIKATASLNTSDESAGNNDNGVSLKRNLGLFNGVAMVVGLVVGSGIFVSPVGVLANSGSVALSLIFWAIGGIAAAIGSMAYVELGTSIPDSGGDYAYIGKLTLYSPCVKTAESSS